MGGKKRVKRQKILYCVGDKFLIPIPKQRLEKHLPDYDVIAGTSIEKVIDELGKEYFEREKAEEEKRVEALKRRLSSGKEKDTIPPPTGWKSPTLRSVLAGIGVDDIALIILATGIVQHSKSEPRFGLHGGECGWDIIEAAQSCGYARLVLGLTELNKELPPHKKDLFDNLLTISWYHYDADLIVKYAKWAVTPRRKKEDNPLYVPEKKIEVQVSTPYFKRDYNILPPGPRKKQVISQPPEPEVKSEVVKNSAPPGPEKPVVQAESKGDVSQPDVEESLDGDASVGDNLAPDIKRKADKARTRNEEASKPEESNSSPAPASKPEESNPSPASEPAESEPEGPAMVDIRQSFVESMAKKIAVEPKKNNPSPAPAEPEKINPSPAPAEPEQSSVTAGSAQSITMPATSSHSNLEKFAAELRAKEDIDISIYKPGLQTRSQPASAAKVDYFGEEDASVPESAAVRPQILYCDGNLLLCHTIERIMLDQFPRHEFVYGRSVTEGFAKLTGVDLKDMNKVTIESVTDFLRGVDLSQLKLLITEGENMHSFACAKNDFLKGQDAIVIARNLGFKGKSVYFSRVNSMQYRDETELFDTIVSKEIPGVSGSRNQTLRQLVGYAHRMLD
jgi:hypothetical protein